MAVTIGNLCKSYSKGTSSFSRKNTDALWKTNINFAPSKAWNLRSSGNTTNSVYRKYSTTVFGGLVEEEGATSKKFQDRMCHHKSLMSLGAKKAPLIPANSFVAPSASVTGNVTLMDYSSIWYGCIIRGDVRKIYIGVWSNIQDETVVTEAFGPLGPDHEGDTIIGNYVTVGHKCTLRACTIEDECLVGMGSVLEEGSYMEAKSMLAAGSVLTKGTRVPSGELWMGNPAKFYRKVTDEEIEQLHFAPKQYYHRMAKPHMKEFFVPSTLHRQAEKLGFKLGWTEQRP